MKRVMAGLMVFLVCMSCTSCMKLPLPKIIRVTASPIAGTEAGKAADKQRGGLLSVTQRKQLSPRVRVIKGYGRYILPDGWKKSAYSTQEIIVYYSGLVDSDEELGTCSIAVSAFEAYCSPDNYYAFKQSVLTSWEDFRLALPESEIYVMEGSTLCGYPLVYIYAVDTDAGIIHDAYYLLGEGRYLIFQSLSRATDSGIVATLRTMVSSFRWEGDAEA